MKTQVDKYRGWEITFDSEQETFSCYSDQYDREEKKKSFAQVKKFIDEFLMENSAFKPFKIMPIYDYIWSDNTAISTVVGIRKDGRFIVEDGKRSKFQLSEYDENKYCLFNQNNLAVIEQASEMNKRIRELQDEREKYLAENFVNVPLGEMRASIRTL